MLPVVPAVLGEPAPGFVVGRRTAEPDGQGHRTREPRARLAEATTEPVNIAGSRDRVRDVVPVGVTDAAVRLDSSVSATVLVEVLPAPIEREVGGVPIRWRNLGGGMRAQVAPSVGKVSVRGRREALEALGADAIEAFVDLAGLGAGRYICEFRSIHPSTSDSTRSRPASSK